MRYNKKMDNIKKYKRIYEEFENIKICVTVRDRAEIYFIESMLSKLEVSYDTKKVVNKLFITIPSDNYKEVNDYLRMNGLDNYVVGKINEQVKWKTEDGKKIPYSDNPDMEVVKEEDDFIEVPKKECSKKNKKYESIYTK